MNKGFLGLNTSLNKRPLTAKLDLSSTYRLSFFAFSGYVSVQVPALGSIAVHSSLVSMNCNTSQMRVVWNLLHPNILYMHHTKFFLTHARSAMPVALAHCQHCKGRNRYLQFGCSNYGTERRYRSYFMAAECHLRKSACATECQKAVIVHSLP